MVLSAGAQILTVHGRTREMKGQKTGLADWQMIRFLRDSLPPETVIFANGNILYQEDIARCLEITGADAVMAAEGNLYNPAIFAKPINYSTSVPPPTGIDELFPRVDVLLREYFALIRDTPGEATRVAAKSHLFRLLRPFLAVHTDVRATIAKINRSTTIEDYENITIEVEKIVANILADEENQLKDIVVRSEQPIDDSGAVYKDIPYWRAQPYFRPVSGQILYGGKRKGDDEHEKESDQKQKKDKQESSA